VTDPRERLAGLIQRVGALLRQLGQDPELASLEDLKKKLLEEQLQVVVMGEFKRGKSTLINALVGEPVLPMAAIPLTSVVTVVRYGPARAARVEFQDGRVEAIAVDQVADYVAEDRNPKNRKGVGRVVVEVPTAFLREGIYLVDTPGVGSVYRHNTEVAQRYLPEADAIVLVLTVDPPISQSELEFLHSIRRWAKRLYVVLNKTDYLGPAELQQSVRFVRNTIHVALGDGDAALFPLSAKRALEARAAGSAQGWRECGMAEFADALERLFTDEKRKLLNQSVADRVGHLLENLRLETELELKALTGSLQDLDRQAAAFRQSLEGAKRKRYEFSKLYQAEIQDHLAAMEAGLYEFVRGKTEEIVVSLESLYSSMQQEPSPAVRAKLNESFLKAAEEAFLQYLEKEEPRWTRAFQDTTSEYLTNVTGLLNQALQQAQTTLGVPHQPIRPPALAVDPPSVWFVLEEVTIWVKSFLPTPTLRMFKPVFLRAIKRQVAEAMDTNAGRLRYDYTRRLEKAAGEVQEAVETFFESSLQALGKAVAAMETRRTLTQEEVQRKSAALRRLLDEISGMAAELLRAAAGEA